MSATARLPVVGLTGGIGSGKSAAALCFAAQGVDIVDTDVIAHQLTAPGGMAIAEIRASFGDDSIGPDGGLDRAAMRVRAFADPAQRARLQDILHPMIRDEAESRLAVATSPYALLVVPLLVESGMHYRQRCDRIVVVDCAEDIQIARTMARSNLPRAQVEAIMAAQATRAQRLAAADDVIDNSGDLAALEAQVLALHGRYVVKGFFSTRR